MYTGHVAHERRINVAMSRARKRLLVVGSSRTLVRPWGGGKAGRDSDLWYGFKQHTDARVPLTAPMPGCGGARQERYAGYKVKLCKNLRRCHFDRRGRCVFAHGDAELRCRQWTLHDPCHAACKGQRCPYRHDTQDPAAAAKALRSLPGPQAHHAQALCALPGPRTHQTPRVGATVVTLGAFMH